MSNVRHGWVASFIPMVLNITSCCCNEIGPTVYCASRLQETLLTDSSKYKVTASNLQMVALFKSNVGVGWDELQVLLRDRS